MGQDRIGVGIVGANPDRGWALRAHVPALRALPRYALTAVGTTRQESAAAAAERFGARHAFTDARELAAHPDVDVVVITVRVPAHDELVRVALAAGKAVYCEWPLARTTAEATGLLAAATGAGVRTAVGLQTRWSPALAYARDLVAAGRVGRVTSVTLRSTRAKGAGGTVPGWSAYTHDPDHGAGLLEVIGGHGLDVLEHLGGDLAEVSATLAVRHPRLRVAETGEEIDARSADHVLLTGRFGSGAVLDVHLHEAEAADPRTRLEIAGTDGTLVAASTGEEGPGDLQLPIARLVLHERRPGAAREVVPVPSRYLPAARGTGAHVSGIYAALADDLTTGSATAPGFADGVRAHRLLDAVRAAAASGSRQRVPPRSEAARSGTGVPE